VINSHRLFVKLVADIMTHIFEYLDTGANHFQLVVLRSDYQLDHNISASILSRNGQLTAAKMAEKNLVFIKFLGL